MLVIALGVWTVVVTQLGIPGSYKLTILLVTGVAIAALGFLLRGEAISRGSRAGRRQSSFVESSVAESDPHVQKDGINSLN